MTESILRSRFDSFADPHLINVLSIVNCPIGVHSSFSGINLATSTAWPTAKLVAYIPIVIEAPFTVRTIGWQNGTSPVGNIEVGVYDETGARKVTSGSTAAGTSAAIQLTTPTAVTLYGPARYYFAVTCENSGGSYTLAMQSATLSAGLSGSLGLMTETTGSFGLTDPWGSVAVLTAQELFPNVFIADYVTV